MNGTKIPTTFPIDLTPPKMTNAVTAIMTIPVTTIGTLNELFKAKRLREQQAKRDPAATESRDAAHCLPLKKRAVPSLDTKKDCRPMRCLQSEPVHDLSFSFSLYERMAATTSSTCPFTLTLRHSFSI